MATKIARHNTTLLKKDENVVTQAGCNCSARVATCPVQGSCKQTGVIYKACIKERISGNTETYTGLTARQFKQRWREHQLDFSKSENGTKSKLSSHIWNLKDQGLEFDISWSLIDRAPSYNPVTKKCTGCKVYCPRWSLEVLGEIFKFRFGMEEVTYVIIMYQNLWFLKIVAIVSYMKQACRITNFNKTWSVTFV